MKNFRRVLMVVLSFAFISVMILSNYTAVSAADKVATTCVGLGDSVVSGYGLESFTSSDNKNKVSTKNFVTKLAAKLGKKAVNLGIEGLNSTQLLQYISNPKTTEQKAMVSQLKTAGIITVSIGGNNVFTPILNAVASKLPEGKTIFTASATELQVAAFGLLMDTEAMNELQTTITQNAAKFTGDDATKKTGEFDSIITQVKKLNPKAQIIVLTVYNPYKSLLPAGFNQAITAMNAKIVKSSASSKNYKVADVYSAFEKADKSIALVNSASGTSFDPHPTARGHEVIYTLVAYAAQGTLPYKMKNLFYRGTLKISISEGNLVLTVTPLKGYTLPESIGITLGKNVKQDVKLTNGLATLPIAGINTDFTVSGACLKEK